jgi:hypothetical protein
MPDPADYLGWAALVIAVPVVAVTVCFSVAALIALTARRPSTRRHCLRVLASLTRYASMLRGQQ